MPGALRRSGRRRWYGGLPEPLGTAATVSPSVWPASCLQTPLLGRRESSSSDTACVLDCCSYMIWVHFIFSHTCGLWIWQCNSRWLLFIWLQVVFTSILIHYKKQHIRSLGSRSIVFRVNANINISQERRKEKKTRTSNVTIHVCSVVVLAW